MPPPPTALAQALAHHRAGRMDDALAGYEEILRVDPAQPDALHLLGQVYAQRGDTARSAELFGRAVAARPAVAAYHLNHGLALRRLARTSEALAALNRARRLDPQLAEAHHQAGNTLKSLGRHLEAQLALREALRLAPAHTAAWLNLGVSCLENGARAEAIVAFQRATALEPQRPEAHNVLGTALLSVGRSAEAEDAFATSLRLLPGYAAAHDNLGRLCRAGGRLAEAVEHFRAALAVTPDPNTHSNLLFALNFLPDTSPGEILAEHRAWNDRYAAALTATAIRPPPRTDTSGRLRVGYLSPDFDHHAVAYFIEPVLAAHDRTKMEVFCYSNVAVADRFTERMKNLSEHWRDIARLDDDAAAELICADKLDLLVDLAGHSARHRLLVFARRPAGVQATWIGYPNTTGITAMDYRITDAISDPIGKTDRWYTEKLARLPANFSCYRPDDDAPAVNALPAAAAGRITFGCLNQFAKVTPKVVELWARLLAALPTAQLFLKSRGLDDPCVAQRVRAAFAESGLSGNRLLLDGKERSVAEHLRLYHGVDIALDPFPYNGTTTTCEALWMGVPVLTLAGQTHIARVGASLLTHAGLPHWIATTLDDYLRRAIAAANDLLRLARLRGQLRPLMAAGPLCDAARFTRDLETAYAAMAARRL